MTRAEILTDFNELFGFIPSVTVQGELGRIKRGAEQTIITNEIRNVMHQLADAKGEAARLLRIRLDRMRKAGRLLGFRTDFE